MQMVPGTRYIDASGTQTTGRSGVVYVLIDAIVAIQGIDSNSCRILMSGTTDWLQLNAAAMDVIKLMKATG